MLLSKGNILLQVYFAGTQVRITPVIGEYDNGKLLSLFARNEEIMTELFFMNAKLDKSQKHLSEYFQHKGWQIEQLPLTTNA